MPHNLVHSAVASIQLSPEYICAHIEQFKAIAADIPKESWTLENYLYDLPRKWEFSMAVTAVETGQLIGFVIASDKSAAIHIHKFAVHPHHRNSGIGQQLLSFFERRVKQAADCKTVSLYVDTQNEGAIRFYERNGFEAAGSEASMALYKKKLGVIVAIHQPNFFPWLGFFHKLAHCDKFIILDHVTNKPGDQIYPRRVQLVCNSQPYWLTIPLEQPKGETFIPINRMTVAKNKFGEKQLKTIEMNYKKTPYFDAFFNLFTRFYHHPSPYIAERNVEGIRAIATALGNTTPVFVSSAFNFAKVSNELLIDLIKAVGGDVYLHGSYAVSEKGYQDNDLFHASGIQTNVQAFRHPVYEQHTNKNAFIPGMSVMDALMNAGAEYVADLIKMKCGA